MMRRLSRITIPAATGTPTNQPNRNTNADVDESFEENSHHITTIANAKLDATIAFATRVRRAAATIKTAGPTLSSAGRSPAVNGFASAHSSVVHVHMLPIEEPTTAEPP